MNHRERLLAAARDLVQQNGYSEVTARDLVAASGTNLASIGYHFGSKDALLQEAINSLFDEWNERLRQVAMADPDVAPTERVAASWRALLDEFPSHRELFVADIEATARASRSEPLRRRVAAHYDQARERFAETVRAALGAEGERQGIDARAVAAFLLAVGDGLMLQHLVDPDGAPSADDIATALGAALPLAFAAGREPASSYGPSASASRSDANSGDN